MSKKMSLFDCLSSASGTADDETMSMKQKKEIINTILITLRSIYNEEKMKDLRQLY